MIIFELFYVFFYIGLFTIGGGYAMIPLMQQELVNARHWIDVSMLTNFIGISQVTPGAIAINLATFIGTTVGGLPGALLATIGVVLPSFIIMLVIAKFFSRARENFYFQKVMRILHPVVIALIISAVYAIVQDVFTAAQTGFTYKDGIVFAVLVAMQLIWKKINPILLLGIAAAMGVMLFGLIP